MYHDPIPSPVAVQETSYVFKTADGAELVGQMYMPGNGTKPFAVVILNGATGVPQGFYAAFATWLAAERGLACFTYDYRDLGRSRQGSLRRSKTVMADWGIRDAEAARRFVRKTLPGTPIWMMGHSLGGMMLPFQRDLEGVARVINVGSGAVHHTDHPWPYQGQARLFWFALGPVLTLLNGYLPSKLIGMGENLPSGAFWQWRRWCTRDVFYDPDAGFELPAYHPGQLKMPVNFVSIADDELCMIDSTRKLARRYETGAISVIDPRPQGDKLGHLGVFQRRNAKYWPELIK